MKEQIDAAIAAHAMWKFKLKTAINGGDLPDAATVRLDNRCDFGKWLYSVTPTGVDAAHHAQIKQLHADFHRAAAAVISDLEAGRPITEDVALGKGSAFFNASSKLTQALINWKTAAAA